MVQLVFGMALLPIYRVCEDGSEHVVCFEASLRLTNVIWEVTKSPKDRVN